MVQLPVIVGLGGKVEVLETSIDVVNTTHKLPFCLLQVIMDMF